MGERSLTRRNFMRLGAGAAAFGAAPKPWGLDETIVDPTANDPRSSAEDSPTSRRLGTDSEMAVAEAWVRAFPLPSTSSTPAGTKLLPDVLTPPFSFVYGDRPSTDLLPVWKCEVNDSDLDDTRKQQEVTYTDPKSGLVARCVATIFKDFPAAEWVMYFKNTGGADTPILRDIQALDAALSSSDGDPTIHYAKGATCSMSDFMPMTRVLGKRGELLLQPGGGRSSSQFLPFFNIDAKGEGAVLAIGWSGEWAAAFDRPEVGPHFRVRAGMALTNLKLHPGEEIRTPRILMLFWQGERTRGQNLLRQFILAHHRPVCDGKPFQVPITNHNWGGTPAADHLWKTSGRLPRTICPWNITGLTPSGSAKGPGGKTPETGKRTKFSTRRVSNPLVICCMPLDGNCSCGLSQNAFVREHRGTPSTLSGCSTCPRTDGCTEASTPRATGIFR